MRHLLGSMTALLTRYAFSAKNTNRIRQHRDDVRQLVKLMKSYNDNDGNDDVVDDELDAAANGSALMKKRIEMMKSKNNRHVKEEEDGERYVRECVHGQLRRLSYELENQNFKKDDESFVNGETEKGKALSAISALCQALGFSLIIRPSTVFNKNETSGNGSGNGVFIQGFARAGSVVCMYPGVIYRQQHYTRLFDAIQAGVVSTKRLMQRSVDAAIINAEEWSLVTIPDSLHAMEAKNDGCEVREEMSFALKSSEGEMRKGSVGLRPNWESYKEHVAEMSPLALMHLVKHPAQGMEPNIMVYNYDCVVEYGYGRGKEEIELFPKRKHIPNLMYLHDCIDGEKEVSAPPSKISIFEKIGREWFDINTSNADMTQPVFSLNRNVHGRRDKEELHTPASSRTFSKSMLPLIVGIASQDINDGEEILLNYRLNPNTVRPSWYHPVDEDEDRKRWS